MAVKRKEPVGHQRPADTLPAPDSHRDSLKLPKKYAHIHDKIRGIPLKVSSVHTVAGRRLAVGAGHETAGTCAEFLRPRISNVWFTEAVEIEDDNSLGVILFG